MNVLSYQELIGLRDNIVSNTLQKVDNNTLTAFNILAISGLRIQELYNIFTAEYQGNNMFLVYTLKGSFVRYIDFKIYTPLILECISQQQTIFLPQSKATIERNFVTACNYVNLYVKEKGIETHFFRHVLMKEYNQNGLSVTQIKQRFGLSSDNVVNSYINSQIYTK